MALQKISRLRQLNLKGNAVTEVDNYSVKVTSHNSFVVKVLKLISVTKVLKIWEIIFSFVVDC